MYQFYYANLNNPKNVAPFYVKNVQDVIYIKKIKPTMWEEHCLECSAPVCYRECPIYQKRVDGRCQRFENSIAIEKNNLGNCCESARLKFRQWSNMMTIVFPSMLGVDECKTLVKKNERLGTHLKKIAYSKIPTQFKWQYIRGHEYLRRRKLRRTKKSNDKPNMFVFHGYSFAKEAYHLFIELYDDHTPIDKMSLLLTPGENLIILNQNQWFYENLKTGYLIKVYPEDNLNVELDILWCDFVQAELQVKDVSSEKVKCLVWDLDNTLWDGILIEQENPETLKLKPGVIETIKALDQRGIIQSIASKNDFDLAWSVVKRLGLDEYFLYPQIHWNAKSASIKAISENLNIGIDSLAFIDDSIFEREQVHSIYSQVRVYEDTEVNDLLNLPEFSVMVTEESKNRRKMYKAEESRVQLQLAQNMDLVDFIRKSNLSIHLFDPIMAEEKQRCYELVVRTNQLNMSGRKYTPEEFDKIFNRAGYQIFAFSCQDDFGEYGIVGFGQYYKRDNKLIFTEFAMSCRVAGKYVESALFFNLLLQNSCEEGYFSVKKTKKNGLLVRTLKDIGFIVEFENDEKIDFKFNKHLKECYLVKV